MSAGKYGSSILLLILIVMVIVGTTGSSILLSISIVIVIVGTTGSSINKNSHITGCLDVMYFVPGMYLLNCT